MKKKVIALGAVVLLAAVVGSAAGAPALSFERMADGVQRVAVSAFDSVMEVLDRFWDREEDSRHQIRSAQADGFSWSGSVDVGDVIAIRSVNGEIVAGAAPGDEVVVIAVKRARRSDADEVRIEVIEHEGGVTVCAVYPSREGERENRCGVGDDYRMNTGRNDVQVDFEVLVPAGVEFEGRTVNGDIVALDLDANSRVSSVNGDIEITTRGFAEASTVNGSRTRNAP